MIFGLRFFVRTIPAIELSPDEYRNGNALVAFYDQ